MSKETERYTDKIIDQMDTMTLLLRAFDSSKDLDYIALEQKADTLLRDLNLLLDTGTIKRKAFIGRGRRAVICVENLMEFESAEHAGAEYGCTGSMIRKSCSNDTTIYKIQKSFMYLDEYKKGL